jgi:acetone carboxylase gamma subunit
MALPEGYVKEARSFMVDNSLFQKGDVIRCLCGYAGSRSGDWLHFRAVAVHSEHYTREPLKLEEVEPPVNAVRIYVCPRCGTAKLSVYETEDCFMLNRHPLDLGYEKVKERKKQAKKGGDTSPVV